MKIRITNAAAKAVGYGAIEKLLNIHEHSFRYGRATYYDMEGVSQEQASKIRAVFEKHEGVQGIKGILSDLDVYLGAVKDERAHQCKTMQQFEELTVRLLAATERKHVYRKDEEIELYLAYYVERIVFRPEERSRDGVIPESVCMTLAYEIFGGATTEQVAFYRGDVKNKTAEEALRRKGLYLEAPALRARYEEEVAAFNVTAPAIGKQFYGVGWGAAEGSSWRRSGLLPMEREDGPTKVVVDVFEEEEEKRKHKAPSTTTAFWLKKAKREEPEDAPAADVPLHPYVKVFDLRRHARMEVHIAYLSEYKYDEALSEKLVLPDQVKELVKLLVLQGAGSFKDIIANKAGGAVVLLSGAPGTGKTLTAEVYAESERKPLYSIQASQLGLDAATLEKALMDALARAKRWNAVMLIDEADVYVRQRGDDIHQNAIVGVFLRVLEYHGSVLFLTTNRSKDVDDAISSRCVAKIDYATPTPEEQARIWAILAAGAGIALPEKEIQAIVHSNPGLSGRDVKNLLKLAQLVVKNGNRKMDVSTIEFVKRFKPTTT